MCQICSNFNQAKTKDDVIKIFSQLTQADVNEICSHSWRYSIIPRVPKLSIVCDPNKLTTPDFSNLLLRFRDQDYLFYSFRLKTKKKIILSSFYEGKELQKTCLKIKSENLVIDSSWLDIDLVNLIIQDSKLNPVTDFSKLPDVLNNHLFTLHKWQFSL